MRRDWQEAHRKCAEEGECRWCSRGLGEPHHIVWRSLGGDDHPDNIMPLCRDCHRAVHAKRLDILAACTAPEQVHAVELLGIQRAHMLLAPSEHRMELAA